MIVLFLDAIEIPQFVPRHVLRSNEKELVYREEEVKVDVKGDEDAARLKAVDEVQRQAECAPKRVAK